MTTRRTVVSAAERRVLDDLHSRGLNFDPARRESLSESDGWHFDRYCRGLPPEPPGPPLAGGSWAIAVRLLREYQFADPSIVRAVYHPDEPLEHRTMLLEARLLFLRFLIGVRIGGVTDTTRDVDGRAVRVFGWDYRTLEGHLEMGQMDYEIWKWLDSGEVEFRICRYVRRGNIRNPIVRLGFRVFGRFMQVRFAERALDRMEDLVEAELAGRTIPRTRRRLRVRAARHARGAEGPLGAHLTSE